MNKWYIRSGKHSDIVPSIRIRLARNLANLPFTNKMNDEQKFEVIQKVSDSILKSEENENLKFKFIDMDKSAKIEGYSMAERHLISPEFTQNTRGRALLLNEDESICIMLNEEDHVRIQVLASGLDFNKAFEKALEVENLISNTVEFAFDSRFGYLTQCPTNVGTGLRASAMLHLYALEKIGAIRQIANTISKLGLTIRGSFGEGSAAMGAMYQISNQVTLGVGETSAIENLDQIINQIIDREIQARNRLNQEGLEDEVYRALGILRHARLLSSKEFNNLISKVRLGIQMKIINQIDLETISELSVNTQSSTLQLNAKVALENKERDKLRAKLVREKLQER